MPRGRPPTERSFQLDFPVPADQSNEIPLSNYSEGAHYHTHFLEMPRETSTNHSSPHHNDSTACGPPMLQGGGGSRSRPRPVSRNHPPQSSVTNAPQHHYPSPSASLSQGDEKYHSGTTGTATPLATSQPRPVVVESRDASRSPPPKSPHPSIFVEVKEGDGEQEDEEGAARRGLKAAGGSQVNMNFVFPTQSTPTSPLQVKNGEVKTGPQVSGDCTQSGPKRLQRRSLVEARLHSPHHPKREVQSPQRLRDTASPSPAPAEQPRVTIRENEPIALSVIEEVNLDQYTVMSEKTVSGNSLTSGASCTTLPASELARIENEINEPRKVLSSNSVTSSSQNKSKSSSPIPWQTGVTFSSQTSRLGVTPTNSGSDLTTDTDTLRALEAFGRQKVISQSIVAAMVYDEDDLDASPDRCEEIGLPTHPQHVEVGTIFSREDSVKINEIELDCTRINLQVKQCTAPTVPMGARRFRRKLLMVVIAVLLIGGVIGLILALEYAEGDDDDD